MNAGNKFFQDHKPWEALKADEELCGSYLAACMGLVALLAALVEPYMPSITIKVVISSIPAWVVRQHVWGWIRVETLSPKLVQAAALLQPCMLYSTSRI